METKIVFIDSEPPSVQGGGIRAYFQETIRICGANGIHAEIYSHNPDVYNDCPSHALERKPAIIPGLGWILYKFCYRQNLEWEYSRWIADRLLSSYTSRTLFEFCDYNGYAWSSLRNKKLRKKVIVRIHTPLFLISQRNNSLPSLLNYLLLKYREVSCLKKAEHLCPPSSDFVYEKLSWLKKFTFIPYPLPGPPPYLKELPGEIPLKFLYVGRIENRKGIHILIKAAEIFLKKEKSASLTIAGAWNSDKYSNDIRELIDSLSENIKNRINIAGEVSKEELRSMFLENYYCLTPSLWENCPFAFFEPLNAGLYCIGSSTGEMGRFLRRIKGSPVTPGNYKELADEMSSISRDPVKYRNVLKAQYSILTENKPRRIAEIIGFYKSFAGEK